MGETLGSTRGGGRGGRYGMFVGSHDPVMTMYDSCSGARRDGMPAQRARIVDGRKRFAKLRAVRTQRSQEPCSVGGGVTRTHAPAARGTRLCHQGGWRIAPLVILPAARRGSEEEAKQGAHALRQEREKPERAHACEQERAREQRWGEC